MLVLPALYHWSPADRFDGIFQEGLRPHATNTVASGTLPYVCTAPDPAEAWTLSGGMDWVSEIDEWDLWQLTIAEHDRVYVRAERGPAIREIKIYGPIPADRVWWVARRGSSKANTCT